MTNQPPPIVFIFTALDCEAKPLVQFFDLKKVGGHDCFSIYRNEKIVLTVAGVGKVAMAGAVAYTLAIFPECQVPVLVNIGIAGHKVQEIGILCIAMKIIDGDTGRRFYPPLFGSHWPKTSELKTTSQPCVKYDSDCLYEMEASAFYEMAVRFSTSELIHCFKVISDNENSSIEKIQPKLVTKWIASQANEIERLLQYLEKLREFIVPVKLEVYNEMVNKWHFTVSGKIKLKALLLRWKVLSVRDWQYDKEERELSGKEVLKKLEAEVNRLEVLL
ncbi:MAG: hypothetical protein KAR12_04660 [Methylococcales bacterium]|nr:hypothetical protein [Methylococcales bacterium]